MVRHCHGFRSRTIHPARACCTAQLGSLSPWYAGLAIVCLVIALLQSGSALINIDKAAVLKQVGYAYAGFEIAACLALLAAILDRRPGIAALSALLLIFDLFVGFRFYTVFAALAAPVMIFRSEAPFPLWRKTLTLGSGAAVFVVCILLAHTARIAVFDVIGPHAPAPNSAMRSDTLQFELSGAAAPPSSMSWHTYMTLPAWLRAPVDIFTHSEQFQTQTVLVETVRQNYVCEARNILKSVTLLIPPGFRRFVTSSYPETFYDEYHPVLFPKIDYGLGGNIWAEMLCRFGYLGDAVFAVVLLSVLIVLNRQIRHGSPTLAPSFALAGVILAFYIHRNDLASTLVMLRQIAIVTAGAMMLAWLGGTLSSSLRRTPDARVGN